MPAKYSDQTRKFLSRWRDHYEDFTDEKFLVSYPIMAMTDRLCEFYSLDEMEEAMSFYFQHGGKDIYHFINNIDDLCRARELDIQTRQLFQKASKDTTNQLKKIMGE